VSRGTGEGLTQEQLEAASLELIGVIYERGGSPNDGRHVLDVASRKLAALTAEVQRLRGVVERTATRAQKGGLNFLAETLRAALTPPAADTEGKDAD